MFGALHNIGSPEVIIIALLVLFFFGGKKLGEFAEGIRKSKKELKNIKEELEKPEKENQAAGPKASGPEGGGS